MYNKMAIEHLHKYNKGHYSTNKGSKGMGIIKSKRRIETVESQNKKCKEVEKIRP
jgi:hypothetical protein